MIKISDKYIAVFSREVSGSSVVVKKKSFQPDKVKDGISYKGRTHLLDLTRPIYRDRGKFFYLIDMEKGQKTMGQITSSVSPKLLDAILRKEIARQLVSGMNTPASWGLAIVIGILGASCGILGGYVIGMFFPVV